jgi:ubiquinone/menaquinone biosynthesis C-methylase UbiE
VIALAEGRVLEIGIGSGLNLPFYQYHVRKILGLEPAPQLIALARRAAGRAPAPVTFIQASAEAIPLEDHSVDTVVTTWTLCTISQVEPSVRRDAPCPQARRSVAVARARAGAG